MKKVIKCLMVILGACILAALIWVCWAWKRGDDFQAAYLRVHRGDSPERVVELFGRQPRFITTDMVTNFSWEESGHLYFTNGKSVQQFHYVPPLDIAAQEWVIGFDDQSNVVSKVFVSSP